MPAVNFVVYELKGKSARAAVIFYNLLESAHKANPIDWQGKNMLEIRKLADEFYTKFLEKIQPSNQKVYATLGLDQQQIQIQGYKDGQPRAYADRPACYLGSETPRKFYMFCPVDYKNQHFVPEGAIRLTEAQAEKIGQQLWAGGWSDPVTVIPSKRVGTALPADFDPAKHIVLDSHHLADDANKPYRFFKAGGQTLATLNALDQAKTTYSAKTSQLFKALDSLKTKLFDAGAIKGVATAKDFYFNFSLGTDSAGRPALQISARREGTGQPLNIEHNSWFKAHGKAGGDYFVEPDAGTAEGLALKAFFDAIPNNPDQQAFPPELLNPETVTPVDKLDGMFGPLSKPLIRHFPDGVYLAYRVNNNSTFVPPGCTEITQAEFLWKEADENDRNMGTTPPPPWPSAGPHAPGRKPEL
ncbi:MAG: hypothetical protein ACXW30_02690 [Micavibrio sp.]